jgi:hypothetical protein
MRNNVRRCLEYSPNFCCSDSKQWAGKNHGEKAKMQEYDKQQGTFHARKSGRKIVHAEHQNTINLVCVCRLEEGVERAEAQLYSAILEQNTARVQEFQVGEELCSKSFVFDICLYREG